MTQFWVAAFRRLGHRGALVRAWGPSIVKSSELALTGLRHIVTIVALQGFQVSRESWNIMFYPLLFEPDKLVQPFEHKHLKTGLEFKNSGIELRT